MFCPNCGSNNPATYSFCRSCGLKLDEISQNVASQFPSAEYAAMIRRKELFEKLGVGSLGVMSVIALSAVLYKAGTYKAALFGEAALLWAALGAFAVFGLLAVFFFNYPKVVLNLDKTNTRLEPNETAEKTVTKKLIEDRVFEPASVTEDSTTLLKAPGKD